MRLTIGEMTRPLTPGRRARRRRGVPRRPRHAGFEATGELRRKEFGIDMAIPPGVSGAMLGDVVKIELDIQLLEPA